MHGDSNELTDLYLTILCNQRRRFVIRYLADHDKTTLNDIADALAKHEADGKPTATDRRAVYTNLYQEHILKLDASDIVAYDDRSKDVEQGHRHARVIDILQCIES